MGAQDPFADPVDLGDNAMIRGRSSVLALNEPIVGGSLMSATLSHALASYDPYEADDSATIGPPPSFHTYDPHHDVFNAESASRYVDVPPPDNRMLGERVYPDMWDNLGDRHPNGVPFHHRDLGRTLSSSARSRSDGQRDVSATTGPRESLTSRIANGLISIGSAVVPSLTVSTSAPSNRTHPQQNSADARRSPTASRFPSFSIPTFAALRGNNSRAGPSEAAATEDEELSLAVAWQLHLADQQGLLQGVGNNVRHLKYHGVAFTT
jgi:hypothetical protein